MDPDRELVVHFFRDPKSLMRMPYVFINHWHSSKEGLPTDIKSKRRVSLQRSILIWDKLISDGWSVVEIHLKY